MTSSDKFVEVKISGAAEIQEKLEHLPTRIGKAIMRSALKAAAEVFRQEMKRRARKGFHVFRTTSYKGQKYKGRSREFGVLSRAIAVKTKLSGDELGGTASIGPSKKTFWGLFEEFGTKHSKGQPFIRPSFDAAKGPALDKFIETAKNELAKNGSPVD